MLNIYVIGCGGIGGYLIDLLPMSLASLSLDMLSIPQGQIQEYLEEAGRKSLPLIADRLTLIDGDSFNARNAIRQGEGVGSKLEQRVRKLMQNQAVLMKSWLRSLDIQGWQYYISPENMNTMIPRHPEPNVANINADKLYPRLSDRLGSVDLPVVFLCVDNKKTRYEVSKYMESFDNCIVINGGNDKTTGHVTIYQRLNGEPLDPNLYEMYPGITEDADKRPDELGCVAIAPQHDQIANTNSIIAIWMSVVFNNMVRYGIRNYKDHRINEVLIDTDNYMTMALYHQREQKEEEPHEEGTGEDNEEGKG